MQHRKGTLHKHKINSHPLGSTTEGSEIAIPEAGVVLHALKRLR